MKKIKIIEDGYIVGIGFGYGESISESEYNHVLSLVNSRPTPTDGYTYKLRADTLEWELVELPPIDDTDDEATESDYIDALQDLGVEVDA